MRCGRAGLWTLPRLTGNSWWTFVAVWSLLLAACLWSTVMVLPDIWQRLTDPVSPSDAVGLTVYSSSRFSVIMSTTPEAARAGLRRGDRLLLVNGKPAAFDHDALDRQLAAQPGTNVTVVTGSQSGVAGRHILTRNPGAYRESLAAVGLNPILFQLLTHGLNFIFAELLFLGCAILLMVRRSHDSLAPWASLMSLAFLLGDSSAGSWFVERFSDPVLGYFVTNGAGFSLLLIVLSVFPTGRFEPRWSLATAATGVILIAISEPLPNAQSNVLLLLAQTAAMATIVARFRGMPPGVGRQQIRWALLGFAASVVALVALTLLQFAAMRTDDIGIAAWLRIGAVIAVAGLHGLLLICITVSLLRWRLYDADATISRSVTYGGLTLGLLATFSASEKMVELMGEHYFGERLGALAGALGAGIAAVCFVPLHHRITRWAERRFRSGLVDLRDGLPLLVGDLRETATPAMLADAVLTRVEGGVRASHGAVIAGDTLLDVCDIDQEKVLAWLADGTALSENQRALQCDRSDPLFPLRLPLHADLIGMVGWLLLGPRPDGSFYGSEERDALREIAGPVARALAIAIERERRDAGHRAEISSLSDRFDGLHQLVLDKFGLAVPLGLSSSTVRSA